MTALLHWAWQGLLVAAAVALVLRLMPRLDGATRHAVWWLTLVVVLGLPLVWPDAVRTPATTGIPMPAVSTSPLVLPATPDWLVAVLAGAWLGWVALGVARLAVGRRDLMRLRDDAWPLATRIEAQLTQWKALPAGHRFADVRVSSAIQGACAIGLGRPVILVSRRFVEALDVEALDQIVLHEQAHLDRRDDWERLAQLIIGCLVGLHPAVAYITRQIDLEREVACDDRVVAATRASRQYARSLTEAAAIVARARTPRLPSLVPGALTSSGALRQRVLRLLSTTAPVSAWARSTALTGSAAAAVLAMSAAGAASPLVVFADLVLEGPAVLSASLADWVGPALRVPAPVEVTPGETTTLAARWTEPQPRGPGFAIESAPVAPPPDVGADVPVAASVHGVGVPLEGRPIPVVTAPGPVGGDEGDAAPAPATPGAWGQLQATGATAGRATARAGAGVGAAADEGGKAIGRTANRAGRSIGGFFGRAGAAVASRF